ncbi:hypothetical protein JXB31_01545 [Candidatus Woesearchaeota archaeon]|nr:hypothetical protein [Candidatus Woesearchaeota archaeon]
MVTGNDVAGKSYTQFKLDLDMELQRQNISLEESTKQQQELLRKMAPVGFLAVFILLFINPLMSITGVTFSRHTNMIIGVTLAIIIIVMLVFIFKKLFLENKDTLNPILTQLLIIAEISTREGVYALSEDQVKSPNSPIKSLFLSMFFIFVAIFLSFAVFMEFSLLTLVEVGMSIILGFVGALGFLRYLAFKHPRIVLFFIRHRLLIRILLFVFAALGYGLIAGVAIIDTLDSL